MRGSSSRTSFVRSLLGRRDNLNFAACLKKHGRSDEVRAVLRGQECSNEAIVNVTDVKIILRGRRYDRARRECITISIYVEPCA